MKKNVEIHILDSELVEDLTSNALRNLPINSMPQNWKTVCKELNIRYLETQK